MYSLDTTPYIDIKPTSNLLFDAAHLTGTFKIKAANLTGDIILSAPAGIALSKTTVTLAEAVAGVSITATYDGSTDIVSGAINLTSGALTSTVTVNATKADIGCYTPLYSDRPNIVSDPLMNNLSSYSGWGARELNTDYVYCGTSSIKIAGLCGGSLDFGLTGKLKPNTMYRVKAMVSTNGTGEGKIGITGATATNITQTFTTDMGVWKTLDFTFTTQATLGSINMYMNSCETQTATELYIDNWEMYELFDAPTLAVDPSLLLFDALNPVRTFVVKGANLISDITLTAPTGIILDKPVLTAAEANADGGAIVTAEYDFSAPYTNDSILLTGTSVKSKITINAFNGVENCYVPKYDGTNLISDPLMNSLSTYGGWGNKSIVSDGNAYCNNSGFINGTDLCYPNSGSIDARITWKPNTNYRIFAMVRTELGTMNIGVSNVGQGSDVNFEVPLTNGTWQEFDKTFTTGANAGAGLCFFNGCGNSTGYIGYIDNWQIYELPTLRVDGNTTAKDSVLFTTTGQQISVPVSASMFATGFTVISDNPLFVPSVVALPETGGSLTVTFNGTANAEGNLTVSNIVPSQVAGQSRVIGTTSVSIPMKAVLNQTKVESTSIKSIRSYILNDNIISDFNLQKSASVNMTLYNINGVKLAENVSKLNAGMNRMTINKNLVPGVYLLKLTVDGIVTAQKIVK
ncbi:MAG: carbohydrate binding domain-containing protein [Paludibacteraceae bacterium]